MFQRILVPLDGSTRAEEVLPLAAEVARATSATLLLLHVVSSPIYPATLATEPAFMPRNVVKADLLAARAYLERVITYEHLDDIQVDTVVLEGSPALTILQFAQMQRVDLLMIKSHGQTGFLRWVLGSVAQQLVRYSQFPVLVVRDSDVPSSTNLTNLMHSPRLLVALDGTSQAEVVLFPAAQLCVALATTGSGAIHLTYAIHHIQEKSDAQKASEKINKEARVEAETYLKKVVHRFSTGDLAMFHLTVTTSVVAYTDPSEIGKRILEESKCIGDVPGYTGCDIIAMATHGRHGLQRLLEGSITEHILNSTVLPLLIVHAQQSNEKLPSLAEASHA